MSESIYLLEGTIYLVLGLLAALLSNDGSPLILAFGFYIAYLFLNRVWCRMMNWSGRIISLIFTSGSLLIILVPGDLVRLLAYQLYTGDAPVEFAFGGACRKRRPISEQTSMYAGFWRRTAAWLIDALIFSFAYVLVILGIGALINLMASRAEEQALSSALAIGDSDLLVLPGIIALWLYCALMESSSWQATLGKRVLGVVVTDLEGDRISFGRATGRYWAKYLSWPTMGVGFLMAAFTEKKQALHDALAGCLVVKKEATAVATEPAKFFAKQATKARMRKEAKTTAGEPAKEALQQTVAPTIGPPPPKDAPLTGAGKLAKIGPREERPAKEVPQQTVAPTTGPPPPEDAPLTGAGKLARIGPLEGKPMEGVPQQTVTPTVAHPASERPEKVEIPSPQECRTVYAFVQRALAGQPASLRTRIAQLEELHDALARQFIGRGKPTPEVVRLLDASLHGKCPACGVRIPGETLTAAAMFQSGPMAGKTIFVGGPGPHSRLVASQCPNCDSHELVIYWQP